MSDQLFPPAPAPAPAPASPGPSPRGDSRGSAKASKKVEIANRRRQVAQLALARVPQKDIATQLNVAERTVSSDLAALRAEWAAEHRESIELAQNKELASLAQDERRIRGRMVKLPEDAHRDLVRYQEVILKIMERRAKTLGSDAPLKVDALTTSRVAFVDDVSKILSDPEATARLLDSIQGAAPVLVSSVSGSGGNGNGNGNGAHS